MGRAFLILLGVIFLGPVLILPLVGVLGVLVAAMPFLVPVAIVGAILWGLLCLTQMATRG